MRTLQILIKLQCTSCDQSIYPHSLPTRPYSLQLHSINVYLSLKQLPVTHVTQYAILLHHFTKNSARLPQCYPLLNGAEDVEEMGTP